MSDLAAEVIDLISRLPISQGEGVGQPFKMLPWERRLVRGIVNNRTSAISVGRGNGKSTLLAGVAVAALIGPLRERRGEVVIVASSFAQSKIIFEHCLAFVDPLVQRYPRRLRVSDSQNSATIEDRETGCRVRCIGSDPRRAHGLAPVLTLADEPTQWEATKAEAMIAALRTAAGKIPGSRLVALGTRPANNEHWFELMLNGHAQYAQNHAASMDDPPFRKSTWRKANPSLGHMPELEQAIRHEAALAKRDPAMLAAFRALRLNQGTSDVRIEVLLDADTWASCEGVAARSGPCIWGIDLGTSAAQSAVAAYWPATGALACIAAFPESPSLEKRGLADGVGRLYLECASRGELVQLGELATEIPSLLRVAMEGFGRPDVVVADRWREAELRQSLKSAGVPPTALEVRGMGFRDGAEDVREFRRAVLEGRVSPDPSLLLRGAMAEARTISDPAGNAKLSKGAEGGRRLRARDDAAAAAILAVSAGVRQPAQPRPRWRSAGLAG